MWLFRNPHYPKSFIEESISIRALRRVYKEHCRIGYRDNLTAKEIFQIAKEEIAGDTDAAKQAFAELGAARVLRFRWVRMSMLCVSFPLNL